MDTDQSKLKWVAIIGSRNFVNLGLVVGTIQAMVAKHGKDAFAIVSGGARGVDRMATDTADLLGVTTRTIKPEYDKYPKAVAPRMRNSVIIKKADIVIAFWDRSSRGTMDAVFKAKRWGKKIHVFDEQGVVVSEDRWIDPWARLTSRDRRVDRS